MLSKKHRISRPFFSDVLKRGRSLHSDHFSLKYVKAKDGPQFSLVISKKVIKRAPQRHLLKRRVYEILRNLVPRLGICGVFFTKQGSDRLSFSELKEEIAQLVSQVRP